MAAEEDGKLGGGGALVLARAAFLDVLLGVPGLDESNGADAQSVLTAWRALPKLQFDELSATRVPLARAALEAEYVSIKDLFDVLGVQL